MSSSSGTGSCYLLSLHSIPVGYNTILILHSAGTSNACRTQRTKKRETKSSQKDV